MARQKWTEQELLRRARVWDQAALMEIYDRYREELYRYAYRLLGNREEAEEGVAEVFSRFLLALHRGKGPDRHLRAYLFRMMHNWVQDRYRERTPLALEEVYISERGPQSERSSRPEEWVQQRWRLERLRHALRQLPDRQAQVLVWRFLEGRSLQEIAELLGTTVGAVKALQHRGIKQLRQLLRDEDL